MTEHDLKKMYRTRKEGAFPGSVEIMGHKFTRVDNLRYGTNPHQPAAFYRPADRHDLVLGHYEVIKTGKSGLSQTNLEDMHHAVGILKYMPGPACAVMKHCNPSGVAMQMGEEPLRTVYERARDADAQAAFGGVAVFNRPLDVPSAEAIMETVIETVAAPGYELEAVGVLRDAARFGRNKEIRVVKLPDFGRLPKYQGDHTDVLEMKVFDDGSLVLAQPYLSRVRSGADFVPASSDHPKKGTIEIGREPDARELYDLLFAWYVNIHVRSNGVVIAKNGQTLAVGTGEQDRVGAVQQAIAKAQSKYNGEETLEGAVLASDGFFPFRDAVDAALAAGVRAFVQPGGSVNDYDAIEACNEAGATMVFSMERCFSHH